MRVHAQRQTSARGQKAGELLGRNSLERATIPRVVRDTELGTKQKRVEELLAELPAERMQEGMEQAAEASKDWASEKKEQLVQQTRQRIESLRAKMDDLKQQASEKGEEAPQKWQGDSKPRLQEKLDEAENKLQDLREAGKDSWDNVKSSVSKTMSDLQDAYEAAKAELQEE